ncbi:MULTISPECIES: HD domain-containing protein [unclassified Frankia]|uniref:HD domain-containing protein n=1 Tax=unclassified Frankia TaxID=2632575 RepID=UPI002023DCD5
MVPDTPSLDDAVALATRAHTGQLDKIGEEYIGHPLRVMRAVAAIADGAGADHEHAQMTAVLHDVVEDSAITLDDLAALGYPPAVVAAVDALSHRPGEPVEDYLARVAADDLAVAVKRADMADNSDPTRLIRLPAEQADRYRRRYADRTRLLDGLVAARRAAETKAAADGSGGKSSDKAAGGAAAETAGRTGGRAAARGSGPPAASSP